MSTGTELVQAALRLLQAHSEASSASTGTIVIGKKKLNSMLQTWVSQGIDIQITPADAVGDEVSEPEDTTNAIEENLAVKMEMEFGALAPLDSKTLRANATASKAEVRGIYQTVDIPLRKVSSTTPLGAGNTKAFNSRIFKPRGGVVDA